MNRFKFAEMLDDLYLLYEEIEENQALVDRLLKDMFKIKNQYYKDRDLMHGIREHSKTKAG